MEYTKKNLGSYNLHLIRTDKFKTITIDVLFANKIIKEDISKINFLASILNYSSKKYKTRKDLATYKQDLYSVSIDPSCYRMGNYYVLDFLTTMLNPKYSDKDIFDKTVELIDELIFNPNVENNAFDKKSFDVIFKDQIAKLDTKAENSVKYSIIEMFRKLGREGPISYSEYGYLEDINKIDEENLYEFYKEFIRKSRVDIFIIGDIDFDTMEKSFKNRFKFRIFRNLSSYGVFENNYTREPIQIIKEKGDNNQAKLCIGCTVKGPLTKKEREYVLNLYNIILGSTYDSKIFKTVREKNSLCYNISSMYNKIDGLIIIIAGINKDDLDTVLDLIKEEMENMKKGNITDYEFEKSKVFYKSFIDNNLDNPPSVIGSYYSSTFWGSDLIDEKPKKACEVTKEEIVKIASKVHMDTVILLGGEDE